MEPQGEAAVPSQALTAPDAEAAPRYRPAGRTEHAP
jgi:hypothetical protein